MSDLPLPLGVIALPAIAPLIALIQLLFPGLLGEHWKQYRAAIGVLLSHSTLMTAQWIATFWIPAESNWWLGPEALAWGMAVVSVIGFIGSLLVRPQTAEPAPARIEFIALQGLALASLVWLLWQWISGVSLIDPMLVVALACGAGVVHLALRHRWSVNGRRAAFATESVFLLIMAAGGLAIAQYAFQSNSPQGTLAEMKGDVSTFRFNNQRTGSNSLEDRGPEQPELLGATFQPQAVSGQFLFESTPLVVGESLFIGARHQIQASAGGAMFGVALDQRSELMNSENWRQGDSSTRAIFSSPIIQQGLLYFGEGYHQHQKCRLFCCDARTGETMWSVRTSSHVESPPTIAEGRLYFGAGDDGLYCVNLPQQRGDPPSVAWHYKTVHVDSSPLVAEGLAIVGGVTGDRLNNLKVVALDVASGEKRWERPSETPIPASPSFHKDSVYLGLGNGKFSGEDKTPRGAVWCLNATDGKPRWDFPLESSVLTSPIPLDERVYLVARNGDCYGLNAATGERIWKYSAGEDVLSSPIVSGGRMFVVSSSGVVHCVDADNGTPIWQFERLRQSTFSVVSSPVLHRGKLYIAIGDKLYCVGDKP